MSGDGLRLLRCFDISHECTATAGGGRRLGNGRQLAGCGYEKSSATENAPLENKGPQLLKNQWLAER